MKIFRMRKVNNNGYMAFTCRKFFMVPMDVQRYLNHSIMHSCGSIDHISFLCGYFRIDFLWARFITMHLWFFNIAWAPMVSQKGTICTDQSPQLLRWLIFGKYRHSEHCFNFVYRYTRVWWMESETNQPHISIKGFYFLRSRL